MFYLKKMSWFTILLFTMLCNNGYAQSHCGGNALLVIDMQNDFCYGGSLAVNNANEIIPYINKLINSKNYDVIVFTKDWHPSNHLSFASNHKGHKVGDIVKVQGIDQILWPDHCVQGSFGAKIHPDVNISKSDFVIFKGTIPEYDSYSTFKDNHGLYDTGLYDYLKKKRIKKLTVVGLALDYCVKYTCLDAIKKGFKVSLHLKGTKAVNVKPHDGERTVEELKEKGVEIVK